jgi:hypothetical protein
VQSGRATGTPKSRDAQVETILVLRVARRDAMKARIQADAQLDALIGTAPEPVRAPLRKLTSKQRIRACAALRPGPVSDPDCDGKPIRAARPGERRTAEGQLIGRPSRHLAGRRQP